jgi:leucyl-tRNA synthetase
VEVTDGGARLGATGEGGEVIPSAKMSKSKKNVVDPVNIIAKYGADTARWFVLSDSPPERDVEWTASGAEAASSTWPGLALADEIGKAGDAPAHRRGRRRLLREMHKTIHDVTMGIESFGFNAAIAKLYAFTNTLRSPAPGARRSAAAMTSGAADGADDPASGRGDLGDAGRRGPGGQRAPGPSPTPRCWSRTP